LDGLASSSLWNAFDESPLCSFSTLDENAVHIAPFLADDNVLENKGEGYEFPFFECIDLLLLLPISLVVDPGGLILPPSPLEEAGFFQETNVSNGFLPLLALLTA